MALDNLTERFFLFSVCQIKKRRKTNNYGIGKGKNTLKLSETSAFHTKLKERSSNRCTWDRDASIR